MNLEQQNIPGLYLSQRSVSIAITGKIKHEFSSCTEVLQQNHKPYRCQMTTLDKEATIHQETTTGTDDPSLAGAQAIIKVLDHQYRWLAAGDDLEIGHLWK